MVTEADVDDLLAVDYTLPAHVSPKVGVTEADVDDLLALTEIYVAPPAEVRMWAGWAEERVGPVDDVLARRWGDEVQPAVRWFGQLARRCGSWQGGVLARRWGDLAGAVVRPTGFGGGGLCIRSGGVGPHSRATAPAALGPTAALV